MSREYLFVGEWSNFAGDLAYDGSKEEAVAIATAAFKDANVDLEGLGIYVFDAYYTKTDVVVAFLAGENIQNAERGGYLEHNIRGLFLICETASDDGSVTGILDSFYDEICGLGATPVHFSNQARIVDTSAVEKFF